MSATIEANEVETVNGVACLTQVKPVAPKYSVGQRVWFGGTGYGAGWKIVMGVTVRAVIEQFEQKSADRECALIDWKPTAIVVYDLAYCDPTKVVEFGSAAECELSEVDPVLN